MDVIFPFEYEGKNSFGSVFRPVAKITFFSSKQKISSDVWLVVDTGADFTILPKFVAQDLLIDFEKDCVIDKTMGVGGGQTIYLFKNKIHVKIGNIEKDIPVAFFDSDEIPALLGRQGFMETFDTEFLTSHKVVFRS